jgi:two-component system catabolic regulation response regulator CreB
MDRRPPHILLVEDEPSLRDNVVIALEAEAMRVSWAGTGADADALLTRESIDLVLLDVGLPDTSGFDLCRDWRARRLEMPVLFLTARDSEIDRVVGLEIGGDDYLVKPFSLRELAARIRAVLRRSNHPPAASPAATTGLHIDEPAMRILADGRPLELTRYEFRLLRVFLTNPGRVFSRAQLMDLAWEEPEASFDRTVDAHVKQLRAKLGPHADAIRTHRGLGYSYTPTP